MSALRTEFDALLKQAKASGWSVGKETKQQGMAERPFTRGGDSVTIAYWHGKGQYGSDFVPLSLFHGDKEIANLDVLKMKHAASGKLDADSVNYANEYGKRLLDTAKRLLTAKPSK